MLGFCFVSFSLVFFYVYVTARGETHPPRGDGNTRGGVRGLRFCGLRRFFVRFFGFPEILLRFFGSYHSYGSQFLSIFMCGFSVLGAKFIGFSVSRYISVFQSKR